MSSHAQLEESFLRSQRRKGRTPHAVKLIEMVTKKATADFFREMLNDTNEAKLWMMFMSGKTPQLGVDGKEMINPATGTPFMVDIELNPISLKAFLRAVEYKRGMPVQVVKEEGSVDKVVEIHVIGANPAFFEAQAKAKGLLKG